MLIASSSIHGDALDTTEFAVLHVFQSGQIMVVFACAEFLEQKEQTKIFNAIIADVQVVARETTVHKKMIHHHPHTIMRKRKIRPR